MRTRSRTAAPTSGRSRTKSLSYSTEFQPVGCRSAGACNEAKPLPGLISPLDAVHEPVRRLHARGTPGTGGGRWRADRRRRAAAAPQPVADAILKKLVGPAERPRLQRRGAESAEAARAQRRARNKLSIHTDAVARRGDARSRTPSTRTTRRRAAAPAAAAALTGTRRRGRRSGDPTLRRQRARTKPAAPPNVVGSGGSQRAAAGISSATRPAKQDDAPIHAQAAQASPRRAEGRVHLRPDPRRDVPVVARQPTTSGSRCIPGTTQPYHASPDEPQDQHRRHDRVRDALPALNPVRAVPLPRAQLVLRAPRRELRRLEERRRRLREQPARLHLRSVPDRGRRRAAHERSNMPAMIIGGKATGLRSQPLRDARR